MLLACAIGSVFFAACAGAPAQPASSDGDIEREVALTRSALAESSRVARAYGQAQLGHFLHLDLKKLERQGLLVPATVSVTVKSTHNFYCIVATNDELPTIHPWARASVTSQDSVPSSRDRCNR